MFVKMHVGLTCVCMNMGMNKIMSFEKFLVLQNIPCPVFSIIGTDGSRTALINAIGAVDHNLFLSLYND